MLYSFRRCPYAMRARMAISYSALSVALREVVLREMPAALLQCSPKGTVPVLVLPDGQVLEEGRDIIDWALAQQVLPGPVAAGDDGAEGGAVVAAQRERRGASNRRSTATSTQNAIPSIRPRTTVPWVSAFWTDSSASWRGVTGRPACAWAWPMWQFSPSSASSPGRCRLVREAPYPHLQEWLERQLDWRCLPA